MPCGLAWLCSKSMRHLEKLEKYEGIGNDFLIALVDEDPAELNPSWIVALLDRHRGMGADGLIVSRVLENSDVLTVSMLLYNADGSRAEMSGNGIRCLAHAVFRAGWAKPTSLRVDTDAGLKTVTVVEGDPSSEMALEVDMGEVSYRSRAFVKRADFSGEPYLGTDLDVGNPHLVFLPASLVEKGSGWGDIDDLDLSELGPAIESSYPQGTNIEWLSVDADNSRARMRVWERGAGITMACGTGSTAAAFLLLDQKIIDDEVEIVNPGGVLRLRRGGDGTTMMLTGPSRFLGSVVPAGHLAPDQF